MPGRNSRSVQLRDWWARHPDERERLAEIGRQRWREQNPKRAAIHDQVLAAIESGLIPAGPCDGCGSWDAEPWIDYEARTVKAWRCRACWKASK